MKRLEAEGDDNCRNGSRKRDKEDDGAEEDKISALPCEILVHILSCLTLKEAASTCVVSRRWRDLWKSFTGVLDFDGKDAMLMFDLKPRTEQFAVARTKYVNWVYQVLNSLQCATVEGFRICFDVDCVQTLEEWIHFAIQKNVKALDLDLSSGLPPSKEVPNFMLPPCLVNAFASLRALRLKSVDVTTETMDSLLSSCVHLEDLSLEHSVRIEALKLSPPSLKLKYLKIQDCFSLSVVEISAMCLLSFTCDAVLTRIRFINVPSLKELSVGGDYRIQDFPSYRLVLSQLQTLKMDLRFLYPHHPIISDIPELGNIIHLYLYASDVSVAAAAAAACDTFFKACTGLQRFTFKSSLLQATHVWKFDNHHPLRCLQVVELLGFAGLPAEVGLLMYLVESSEQLEKIIIDPMHRKAREHALELKAALPLWEFVVL